MTPLVSSRLPLLASGLAVIAGIAVWLFLGHGGASGEASGPPQTDVVPTLRAADSDDPSPGATSSSATAEPALAQLGPVNSASADITPHEKEKLSGLSTDTLRARSHRGDVEAMLALARQLADADPSEADMREAFFWCDSATVLGSTEAAVLEGDLCLTNCNPPNADDPRDMENWSLAAQYYFLAYLMGDERALKRLEVSTPGGVDPSQVYMALGLARMRLEEVLAARAQRGLPPFNLDLNATSPYLKPNSPGKGGEYLLPEPRPGGG